MVFERQWVGFRDMSLRFCCTCWGVAVLGVEG